MKKLFASLMIVGLVMFFTANANAQTANATVTDVSAGAQSIVVFPDPVTESTINSNGHGYRGLPLGAVSLQSFPNAAPYMLQHKEPGLQKWDAKAILFWKDCWTEDEMVKANISAYFGSQNRFSPMVGKVNAGPSTVKWVLEAKKDDYNLVGFGSFRVTNNRVATPEQFAEASAIARQYGADHILLVADGTEVVLDSTTWSVMIGYSAAGLSSDEKTGQAGGGGIGWANTKAGYKDYPWIQFVALQKKVEPAPVTPTAMTPAPEKKDESHLPWWKRSTLM